MKPPGLEYRYENASDWRPMPAAVARNALSPQTLTPIEAVAPDFARLLAGHEIGAMSGNGRRGFIRIAR